MDPCSSEGNSDMYGLGIRIAFYLQWVGTLFAAWIAPTEVPGLRLSNTFFTSATFLALLIQTSRRTITALDTYITLLLTYCAYYCHVPVYAWRLVTGCNPFLDPTRWPLVKVTMHYDMLNLPILIAVTIYQLWFWTTGLKSLPTTDTGCREYGFFFARVPLKDSLFVAVNIFFAIILLLCSCWSLAITMHILKYPRWLEKKEKKFERHRKKGKISQERITGLQFLQTAITLVVASVVIAAVELTIRWNKLTGVDDTSTAGQTIPIIIAAGLLAHVIYVRLYPQHDAGILPDTDKEKQNNTDAPRHPPTPQPPHEGVRFGARPPVDD